MLEFRGLQKTTLIDYPGEIACTFFTSGCNFNCSYCYNPDLVLQRDTGVEISEFDALDFLRERRSFLDAVCVSGGEPLAQPGLLEFLQRVKTIGYKVKLDTNGSFPERLRMVIDAGAVDYLAMDIKAPPSRYEEVANAPVPLEGIEESAALIRGAGVEYEFRTTVFSGLTIEDFESIGRWLKGSRKYCLQPVKVDLPLLDQDFAARNQAPTKDHLHAIAGRVRPFFDRVEIRI